jgi:hypothetical protein
VSIPSWLSPSIDQLMGALFAFALYPELPGELIDMIREALK